MAEVLALVASITALTSLAGEMVNFSLTVLRTARAIKSAKVEMQSFAMRVKNAGDIIDLGLITLDQHSQSQSNSAVLQYMGHKRILKQLADESGRISLQMKKLKPRLTSLRNDIDMFCRIKWLLRRREVEAIGLSIDRIKADLSLIINILILEAFQQQLSPGTPQTRETERRLKRKM